MDLLSSEPSSPENVCGRKGRKCSDALTPGRAPLSSRLMDIFSWAESNGMLREGPCVWVCKQLVAEILERGGIEWKSPVIRSTFSNV